MKNPDTLIHALIRLSLTPPGDLPDEVRTELESARHSDWRRALAEIESHELTGLAFFALKSHGLTRLVPPDTFKSIAARYLQIVAFNRTILSTATQALQALAVNGLNPIVFKGAVFADSLYPDPGARPMGDVDFLFTAADAPVAFRTLAAAGFRVQPEDESKDGLLVWSENGIVFDVHRRFRFFEGHELSAVSTRITPRHLGVPSIRVFEPTAMLAHLVVHLYGHLPNTGPKLIWLIDIIFLLRTWGDRIDRSRLDTLLANSGHRNLLGAVLRFFETGFGEVLPPALSDLAPQAPVHSLAAMLRMRRQHLWGLPGARGWVKALASRLGSAHQAALPRPRLGDLFTRRSTLHTGVEYPRTRPVSSS